MTVLELDRPLARTPSPAPRQALDEPQARGDAAFMVTSGLPPASGQRPTAADVAARLVAAHVPAGLTASADVPVELRYHGQGGHQRLAGVGRIFAGPVRGRPFAAVLAMADPLVLLTVSQAGGVASHWALVPGGPSVTARADALRLLRAMRVPGELALRAGEDPPLSALELAGADTWTPADEDEWQLFEDLATLEEWSGQSVPVPSALSADEVARVGQAAAWVRTERIDASLTGPVRFTVADRHDLGHVDELRLHQDFGVSVAGRELPLGTGDVRIPVEVIDAQAPDAHGHAAVIARPRRREIVFALHAPAGRRLPARRTQPPAARPGPRPRDPRAPGLGVVEPASRSLQAVLPEIRARPLVSAASSSALLDDLRGP